MKVELLTSKNSLQDMETNAVRATLSCHANEDKEVNSKEFLMKIIKYGHESVLEHICLTFKIRGISRACLQELARHRLTSPTVESTRHTLKKVLYEHDIKDLINGVDMELIFGEYADKPQVKNAMIQSLGVMLNLLAQYPEIPNDVLKYFIPEFWPTNLTLTLNVRELRHIIDLRTSPRALKEFQALARELFNAVPDEFKYLLEDCVHEEALKWGN